IPVPQQNHLLAALSWEAQSRLAPYLELVSLDLGAVVYESGDAMRHIYFPTDSIVSLLYVMADGGLGGNFRGGQRRSCGRGLVPGGRKYPEQGGRTECGQRLPAAATAAQRRVQSPRRVVAADVALHAVPDHANGPDGGLQPSPYFGPAAVPLAVAFPGPPVKQYLDDDPGTDRQHAGR